MPSGKWLLSGRGPAGDSRAESGVVASAASGREWRVPVSGVWRAASGEWRVVVSEAGSEWRVERRALGSADDSEWREYSVGGAGEWRT